MLILKQTVYILKINLKSKHNFYYKDLLILHLFENKKHFKTLSQYTYHSPETKIKLKLK